MMLIAIATYLQIQILKWSFMFPSIISFLSFWNIFSSLSISSIYLPKWLKSLSGYQLFWTMWVIYDEHFNVFSMKTRPNMFTCDLSIPKCNCPYLPIHFPTMFPTSSNLSSHIFPLIYFSIHPSNLTVSYHPSCRVFLSIFPCHYISSRPSLTPS